MPRPRAFPGGTGELLHQQAIAAGQAADSTRLRLALDGEGSTTLASGARLSPRFELGLRHDGGDGSSGVEVGGGAKYARCWRIPTTRNGA